jgi:thioredoxin-like negative regulator of GroEL
MCVEIIEQECILRITQALSLGPGDEARALLAQCLRTHPGSARANYLMAVEWAKAGDKGEALLHFAAALDAEPGLYEARLQWAMVLVHVQAAVDVLVAVALIAAHPAMRAYQLGLCRESVTLIP